MQISRMHNNATTTVITISDMSELAKHITKGFGWAPGIFENNHRSLENFKTMEIIALDFDSGMSIEEAGLVFSGYKHIIGTSRSHQIQKGDKPACDRFRVCLQLTNPIVSDAEYKATFAFLRTIWPAADPACSDASRMFYPCKEIYQGDNEGKTIDKIIPAPIIPKAKKELTEGEKGLLSRKTLEFITLGATKGGRHSALFRAAKDMQEQGFNEADTEEMLMRSPVCGEPGMPPEDFSKAVRSAYRKEPKYDLRTVSTIAAAFSQDTIQSNIQTEAQQESLYSIDLLDEALAHLANPQAVKGISTGWPEIDKLLGGLRQSELGIVQAYPKSGKTVFLTNLMANLTQQGHKVGFASLEMHPAKQVEPDLYSIMLRKNVREGVTEEDKTKLRDMLRNGRGLTYFKRVRRPSPEDICNWVKSTHQTTGCKFFFVDHFTKIVPDESSVASVARTITALTGVKYECPEVFICLIVQPRKEQKTRDGMNERVDTGTLRGGACIFDEASWLINMHTKYHTHRTIETSWGNKRENIMVSYPNNIREIEFAAIREKPFSENMGKKIHMVYDKCTTEMKPYNWITPAIEHIAMPDEGREERNRSRPQSGWAKNTWENKRI